MARKARKSIVNFFQNAKGEIKSVRNTDLDRAIDHLNKTNKTEKNIKGGVKKKSCKSTRCAKQLESEIAIHCRQLPSVAYALREALLRHDWNESVVFTLLLCQPGITRYASVIVRACLILLFNHPKSNIGLLEKFIRSCTGYEAKAEIIKFVKILFSTRKEPLPILCSGKYLRAKSMYRIVNDVDFKDL